MKNNNFHEKITTNIKPKVSSDSSFCFVFAFIFFLIGIFPLLFNNEIRVWALILSIIMIASGKYYPRLFYYPNLIWFKFGLLLHKIMNPLILFMIFLFILTPTSILLKLFSYDPMKKKYRKKIDSYWVKKKNIDSEKFDMNNQF